MFNWLKDKWYRFKKWFIALFIGSAIAGGAMVSQFVSDGPLPIVVQTESVTFDTQTIYPDAIEIIEKRTEGSKTHNIGNGFALDAVVGAMHYKENYADKNEQWKDIDLTPVDMGTYYLIDKAPHITKIYKDKIGYEITNRRTGEIGIVELVSPIPD